MSDYKMMIQERADELAYDLYEKDFYDLSIEDRDRVYEQAMDLTNDTLIGWGDTHREGER